MSKRVLFRFAFSLCLLLAVVFGVSKPVHACPRAVTVSYYAWVDPSNPSFHYWCNLPAVSPPCGPSNCGLVWQKVGQEVSDCDGNYSSWGGPCQDLDPGPANTVRTSTACSCGS